METIQGMSRGRRRAVHLLIAVLLGGSLFDIVADAEHWPFSSYQMFARVRSAPAMTRLRMFGVTAEQPPREIPLVAYEWLYPLDTSRLAAAFRRLAVQPDRELLLRTAMRDCWKRYERRRQTGAHNGPPLVGIRLYEVEWVIDPLARNVDHPDRKRLIMEVRPPGTG